MRGIRLFNFPAFDETAKMILALGVGQPISPADIDRAVGFDPTTLPKDYDWNKIPPGLNLREIIDRDIAALKTCHSIYLLKGWEKSTGARAEVALAKWLGLDFVVEYGAKKP